LSDRHSGNTESSSSRSKRDGAGTARRPPRVTPSPPSPPRHASSAPPSRVRGLPPPRALSPPPTSWSSAASDSPAPPTGLARPPAARRRPSPPMSIAPASDASTRSSNPLIVDPWGNAIPKNIVPAAGATRRTATTPDGVGWATRHPYGGRPSPPPATSTGRPRRHQPDSQAPSADHVGGRVSGAPRVARPKRRPQEPQHWMTRALVTAEHRQTRRL